MYIIILDFHINFNQLIWIFVAQDVVKLLRGVHLEYLLYLAHDLNEQMNSDLDEEGKFGNLDLSSSIFKNITFAFENSKIVRYHL